MFVALLVFALSLRPRVAEWLVVRPLLIDQHSAKHTKAHTYTHTSTLAWVMATFGAQITHTPCLPRTHSISTLILLSCVQSMQFIPRVSIGPSPDV